MIKSVACVISSRVECAVAALLLKNKGYNVIGVSLCSDNVNKTKVDQDAEYVEYVCKKLKIPWCNFHPSTEHWDQFSRAVQDDHKKGYSPGVNVLYQKFLTYGSMFDFVQLDLQLDGIATSHYARTDVGYNIDRFTEMKGVKLLKAIDQHTDESYLLCQVKPQVFNRTLLPLGDLTRDVVRKIAESVNIHNPTNIEDEKFTPDLMEPHLLKHLSDLRQKTDKKSGRFVNILNCETLGIHKDFLKYEVGQCCPVKGMNLVVVDKDWNSGDIYLAPNGNHPSLYVNTIHMSLANWIHRTPYHFYAKDHTIETNYRSQWDLPLMKCSLTLGATSEWCDHIILSSAKPLWAVRPGQYCALYQGEECIGSSQVVKAGPSHQKCSDTSSSVNE